MIIIKGDVKFPEKVISILTSLGGINKSNLTGSCAESGYYVSNDHVIMCSKSFFHKAITWQEYEDLSQKKDTDGKLYIRFGDIPSDGKSKVWSDQMVVREEKGVSVYDSVKIDDKWHVVMPALFKCGQGITYENLINTVSQCRYEVDYVRKVYLVVGNQIGVGDDGEPVLENVKIIEDITNQFTDQFV